jgi:hypothetical protein
MNAVMTLSDAEIDMVSGGNALDTTTGSYVTYQAPAQEPGLDPVPLFGFPIALGGVTIRTIMRIVGR